MRSVLAALAILWCWQSWALAAEKSTQRARFGVYEVTTDLQKLLVVHRARTDFTIHNYVVVDGDGLIDNDGRYHAEFFPGDEIHKALTRSSHRSEAGVVMNIYLERVVGGTGRKINAATDILEPTLEKEADAAGFKYKQVTRLATGERLDRQLQVATAKSEGYAHPDEAPVSDALVQVYPVQTVLSHLLCDNSDCVVVLLVPMPKDGPLLSAEVRKSIARQVNRLELPIRDRIDFRLKVVTEKIAHDRINRFVKKEGLPLAKSLGFRAVGFQGN